jgi:hypothetical protein
MHPSRSVFTLLVGSILCAAMLSSAAPWTLGEDFRIDTSALMVNQKQPPMQSVTIFHDNAVYDYMTAPAETVVFDHSAGRVILLNLKSHSRAELTTGELAEFTDRLQQLVARSSDPLVKFLAAPKFQESFNEATGELVLSSPWMSYRLTLVAGESPAAVEQYHEFSDWCARLNALLVPGSCPPFARLLVDAALAQRKAIPSQVERTLTPGTGHQPIIVRSTHRVIRPLGVDDLARVAKTRESMASFKLVSFEQYRKLELR